MTYAKGTTVSIGNSQAEIVRLLSKHKANAIGFNMGPSEVGIGFELASSRVRLRFPLPSHSDKGEKWSIWPWDYEARRARPFDPARDTASAGATRLLDQAVRERWRLIVLCLKTKLELVALGARTIEQEFLDGLVLPNGATVAEELVAVFRLPPRMLALPPAATSTEAQS